MKALGGYEDGGEPGDASRLISQARIQAPITEAIFAKKNAPPLAAPVERNPLVNLYNL
jgi:hypothetical protein